MSADAHGMHLEQRTALLPSAAQLQFLSLLPRRNDEVAELLQSAIRENPLLQRSPGAPCAVCGRHCRSGLCRDCRTQRLPADPGGRSDWRTDLLVEMRTVLPTTLHPVAELVVASLDEHGFLRTADLRGLGPDLAEDTLDRVVLALREVGPPGIGARSAVECLRLQAAALVDAGTAPPVLLQIVDCHLDEVARDDLEAVADATQTPLAEVRRAVDCLRTRTRPFVTLDETGTRFAAPDVLFRHDTEHDVVLVQVTDVDWFGVEIDQEIWDAAGGEGRAWLRPYRRQATDLLRSVHARSVMLVRVATLLAERQRGFLLEGRSAHRPLTRHEVAVELEVHPATVGRAVDGKVARCPDGRLVPLSDFFGGQTSLLEALRSLVETHPTATDAQLSALLAEQGLRAARRTVSKYRGLLRRSAT